MKRYLDPPENEWAALTIRPSSESKDIDARVRKIIDDVRTNGDKAVIDYTKRFDNADLTSLRVPDVEIMASPKMVSRELKDAIELARETIGKFHASQVITETATETAPGVKCWRKNVPVEKVGLYIPGGTAPLFSTVLMLGIPAVTAGCKRIIVCTPPDSTGSANPVILYTCSILGINEIYLAGGAQAIAAMAFGTESIPAVYKIFGPGNRYVTVAKQMVSLENIAIDLPAGPSEVAVIADETADPEFIAADLISQAEHGPDSQVLLVCSDQGLIEKVQKELHRQLADLPRRELAEQSLQKSRIIHLNSREEIIELVNEYAPEHLIIMCRDYGDAGIQVKNAGSVFMGPFTPESAGDYASGTNHTLPAGGYARVYSGLGLKDFQKRISFQEISEKGLKNLGPAIIAMAREEKLEGHGRAVEIRLSKITDNIG